MVLGGTAVSPSGAAFGLYALESAESNTCVSLVTAARAVAGLLSRSGRSSRGCGGDLAGAGASIDSGASIGRSRGGRAQDSGRRDSVLADISRGRRSWGRASGYRRRSAANILSTALSEASLATCSAVDVSVTAVSVLGAALAKTSGAVEANAGHAAVCSTARSIGGRRASRGRHGTSDAGRNGGRGGGRGTGLGTTLSETGLAASLAVVGGVSTVSVLRAAFAEETVNTDPADAGLVAAS